MRPVSLDTLRVNQSVALRNAGYAALERAKQSLCDTYGITGHRFAFVRATLDGTEFWECPCGREAMNARECDLPLMTEDDPYWDEMQAYAGEFRRPLPRSLDIDGVVLPMLAKLRAEQPHEVGNTDAPPAVGDAVRWSNASTRGEGRIQAIDGAYARVETATGIRTAPLYDCDRISESDIDWRSGNHINEGAN